MPKSKTVVNQIETLVTTAKTVASNANIYSELNPDDPGDVKIFSSYAKLQAETERQPVVKVSKEIYTTTGPGGISDGSMYSIEDTVLKTKITRTFT